MTNADTAHRLPLGVTAVMLPELDFGAQLALCAELGVTHYVFRPRTIPADARDQPWSNWGNHRFDLTPERLLAEGPQLRAAVEAAGLVPFGTVPAMDTRADEATWRLNFEAAAAAGAPRVRLTPHAYPEGLFDYPAFLREVVGAYQRAIAIARPLGVKPVIEMHSGNLAIGPGLALRIVEHFSPDEIGLILDLPNFAREGGVNPQLCLSVVRDYIDHCHLGGYRKNGGHYDAFGFREQVGEMCALSESDLPIRRWIELLAEIATPQRPIPLVIEDYSANMSGALRLRRTVAEARRLPQLAGG